MCSFQDRSSLSVTPKYLNELACSRGLSLILIETAFRDFRRRVLPNKTNLDLSQLRVSRLDCNHCETVCKSIFKEKLKETRFVSLRRL